MRGPRFRPSRFALAVLSAILLLAPMLDLPRPVSARQGPSVEVQVVDFAYEPAMVMIEPGTTVTWTNAGDRPHTVTADDGSFDSGRLDPGEQYSFTFDQPGTFTYVCGFHPEMQGSVMVGEAQPDAIEVATPASGGEPAEAAPADESASIASLLSVAQQDGLSATLHMGDCADVGPEVATLESAVVPSGGRVGSSRSLPGANSFTAVPVALDALLAAHHALVVGGTDGETLACGEVGGYLTEAGALIVGFRPEPATGLGGVAFLSPADAPGQTNVSLFLTGEALGGDAGEATGDPEAVASPAQPAETPKASDDETGEIQVARQPTAVPTERPVPTPTPVPLGATQDNPAPLGTPLESQGLAVTVSSAYFDSVFANAIPRGGFKLLILGVTIENVSDENRGYDAARFSGIDALNGNTYNSVTLENVGVLLTNGDLQPGQFVSGTALIEVQDTATSVIVKYDADILGDEEDLYWS